MTTHIKPYAQVTLPGAVVEKPLFVADNSVLIVIAGETLLAIDSVEPASVWANNPVYPGLKGALVSDGVVYCVSGKKLLGFNVTDGACPWANQPDEVNADLLPPVETGDFVYVLDVEGTHYRFSKEYGVEDTSWRGTTYSGIVSIAPVIAGKLLIYAVEKFLIALDNTDSGDGKQMWRFDFGSRVIPPASWPFTEISSPLRANDGELFVCLSDSRQDAAQLVRLSWNPGEEPVPVAVGLPFQPVQDMDLQWLTAPGFAPQVNWLGLAEKSFPALDAPLTLSPSQSLLSIVVGGKSPFATVSVVPYELFQRHPREAVFVALFEGMDTVANASVLVAVGRTVQVRVSDPEATVLNDYQTTIHVTAAPIVGPDRQVYLCGNDETESPVLALFKDISSSAVFRNSVSTLGDSAFNPVAVGILQASSGNPPVAANKAFIPIDGFVAVIDLAAQTPTISKIKVEGIAGTSQGIAVSSKGYVLIAATDSQRVVAFDPAANRVVKTFEVPHPEGIALVEHYQGSHAFVTNWDPATDKVTIIDIGSASPDDWSIKGTLTAGKQPAGIAPAAFFLPTAVDGYVANQHDGTMTGFLYDYQYAPHWYGEPFPERAGSRPFDVAVSQGSQKIYVTNRWDESAGEPKDYRVWVFSLYGKKIAQIELPAIPFGLAIVPNGRWLLVACEGNDTIQVIDTLTFKISDQIQLPAGSGPQKIAVTPDGTRAVVANYSGKSVTVINIQ